MLETQLIKVQKFIALVIAAMLAILVMLSTVGLGTLIVHEIWKAPQFVVPEQGLLEIFGYFLMVLIGVELLEILRANIKDSVVHVRGLFEVAFIAMVRKLIIENT